MAAAVSTAPPADKNSAPPRIRVPVGPNGEVFMPSVLPKECIPVLEKGILPLTSLYTTIDGTPDQQMTLGSKVWWVQNQAWLEKNRAKLRAGMKQAAWDRREAAMAQDDPTDLPFLDSDWVCVHRPGWDKKAEFNPDDDDDDDDDDDSAGESEWTESEASDSEEKSKLGAKVEGKSRKRGSGEDDDDLSVKKQKAVELERKAVGKLADLHPEWPTWICTALGEDRFMWWVQQAHSRSSELQGLYIYNDFDNYGALEVMENILAAMEKALSAKNPQPLAIWAEIEGFARFVSSGFGNFFMVDDGDRATNFMQLMGFGIMATLDSLIKLNVFGLNTPIRNLRLILALVLRWGLGSQEIFDGEEMAWVSHVARIAHDHSVVIDGLYDMESEMDLAALRDEAAADDSLTWRSVTVRTLKRELKRYAADHSSGGKIGGTEYDVTKMSAAEQKKYALGRGIDDDF